MNKKYLSQEKYCEDIRTRRCDENVTGALMLARTLALYFFAKSGMSNCQAFKEKMQANVLGQSTPLSRS